MGFCFGFFGGFFFFFDGAVSFLFLNILAF